MLNRLDFVLSVFNRGLCLCDGLVKLVDPIRAPGFFNLAFELRKRLSPSNEIRHFRWVR